MLQTRPGTTRLQRLCQVLIIFQQHALPNYYCAQKKKLSRVFNHSHETLYLLTRLNTIILIFIRLGSSSWILTRALPSHFHHRSCIHRDRRKRSHLSWATIFIVHLRIQWHGYIRVHHESRLSLLQKQLVMFFLTVPLDTAYIASFLLLANCAIRDLSPVD